MKKIILLVVFILITITSYFFYNYYYTDQNKDAWDFVPSNALVVYDIPSAVDTYNSFKNTGFGKGIGKLEEWVKVSEAFSLSDTSKYGKEFTKSLKNVQVLVSIHTVSKEAIDFVYFVKTSKKTNSLLQEYINDLIEQTNSTLSKRIYNDRNIFEIKSSKIQFSYFLEDGVLIISQTPFLIEDVIRTVSLSEEDSYKSNHIKSFKANKLKNDQGDLYISTESLDSFLRVFLSQSAIDKIANSTFMDVKVNDNSLSLSGFTYSENDDLLNVMKEQQAVKISINSYVPNSTYSVFHTGISDANIWYDNYIEQLDTSDLSRDWDVARMVQWIDEELVLINLNTRNDINEGKLLLIETKDINDALNQLNTLAENTSSLSNDSVFYENYGDVLIKELNIAEFPENIFGKRYSGFSVSYYAIIDRYIVLANSIEAMHELINSVEEEDTWGRTLDKSQWLSHTLEEANISYFFDYTQAVNPMKTALNDTWKKHFESNEQVLKGLGMGAIQFSNIDGQFYTSMMLEYDIKKSTPVSLNFDSESTTYLENTITTKPFVVRNHNNPQVKEVIIQDSTNNIYLIDYKGSITWKDSVDSQVSGNVYQIDYYKNKKLQYLFATKRMIYLTDRNGNQVENYPLSLAFDVDQISVLDYDLTKNYRILISDKKGNLYMYDKEGNNLDGWNPRVFDQPLINNPRHIRVRGKDAIVTTSKDGKIYVMNRKGQTFKGFPVMIENGISGDVHISKGRDFERTIFSVISIEGELIQFDLNGNFINKKQFYKPTKDTFFELVSGVMSNDFTIMRQNAFRISLLNTSEKVIINKDYLTSDKRDLQYYDFGGDKSIYVVNDFVQGYGYIYNHTGKLLNNVPINNQHNIGLLKNTSKNKTFIYSTYQDQVNVYSY